MMVSWHIAIGIGMILAVPISSIMLSIHARVEITRMKRIIDRLVWPMTKAEFGKMQLTYAAFTQKFYADSGNFMSHRELTPPSPEFTAKLEKRLGITA